MKKAFHWLRNNKLATLLIVGITWILHYSIETFIIENILAIGGFTFPNLAII